MQLSASWRRCGGAAEGAPAIKSIGGGPPAEVRREPWWGGLPTAGSRSGYLFTVTQVRVSFCNPKFVRHNYETWQAEGHDACRADSTCAARPHHDTRPHNDRATRSSLVPLTRAWA